MSVCKTTRRLLPNKILWLSLNVYILLMLLGLFVVYIKMTIHNVVNPQASYQIQPQT